MSDLTDKTNSTLSPHNFLGGCVTLPTPSSTTTHTCPLITYLNIAGVRLYAGAASVGAGSENASLYIVSSSH